MITTEKIENNEIGFEGSTFFQLIVNNIDQAICISQINEDGEVDCFLFVNDALCTRLGYSKEEMMRLSVYDIFKEANAQFVRECMAQIFRGKTFKKEVNQIKKNGGIVPVEISVNKIEFEGRDFLVCTSRDMTMQKSIENDVQEKSEKYRALCDAYNDAVFISEKGKCIEQNLAAEKMFGYTTQEALGRYGTEWIIEEDREMVMQNMISGFEEPYEATALRKDGTTFPCLLHGSMMNFRGRTVRTTTLKDISYEKQLKKIKDKNEEELRHIISDMQVGVMLLEDDHKIIFCNPLALDFLGLKLTEVIGTSALDPKWELVHEDGTRMTNELNPLAIVFKTLKPVNNVIVGFRRLAKNDLVWLLVDAIPQFDFYGKFYRVVCTFIDITKRIIAEKELVRNKVLYREIINHDTSAITLLNPDHTYRFVNRKFEETTGFTLKEIIGKNPPDYIHPDDLEELLEKLKVMIDEPGGKATAQYRFLKKNGSYLWVESTFSNLLHIPELNTILISSNDAINERKVGEEKVLNMEKQYKALFENMLDGFAYCKMIYDKNNEPVDWEYLNVNDTFEKITGLENVIGKKVSEIIPALKEKDSKLFEIYSRVSQTGISETFEMYVEALKDWFFVNVYSFDRNYFIAIFDVITERKEAELTITEQNKKLIQAEKVAKIGYWELDLKSKMVYGSEGANKIYGNEVSPITVDKLKSYRLPEYVDYIDSKMKALIEENKPYDVEFKIRRETDGAVIDIHSIADFDSETKVVFGVIQDVTEIKQISKQLENQNKELRKTNAELDKFVYSTSHDLRAPLKSVLGLINLIELEEDPDFIKDQMHMMKSSVVKLDDFIEDIMHYYRNTRLVVNPEEIDFEEIISKIKSNFLHTEGFETVKFFVHIDMPEKLCSDKQRIALVLNNLISNAIKYRDQNKQEQHVKIEIHNNIVSTSITVEDNGIGIEENHSEKIFEMFYRATRHSTGSGLGLYIVKETLDKIGGTIYVESEHGIGTKFTVKIPNLHEQ